MSTQEECNRQPVENPLSILAPREREIAELALQDIPTKDIAVQLGISPSTVRSTLHRVYQKLSVSGIRELSRLVHAESADAAFDTKSDAACTADGVPVEELVRSRCPSSASAPVVPYFLALCGVLILGPLFLNDVLLAIPRDSWSEWLAKLMACEAGIVGAWLIDGGLCRFTMSHGALQGKVLNWILLGTTVLFLAVACGLVIVILFAFDAGALDSGYTHSVLLQCVACLCSVVVLAFACLQLLRFKAVPLNASPLTLVSCALVSLLMVHLADGDVANRLVLAEGSIVLISGVSRLVYHRPVLLNACDQPRTSLVEMWRTFCSHIDLALVFMVSGFMVALQVTYQFDITVLGCMAPFTVGCLLGMVFCCRAKWLRPAVLVAAFTFALIFTALPTRQGFAIAMACTSCAALLMMYGRSRFEARCDVVVVAAFFTGAVPAILPGCIRDAVSSLEAGSFLSLELYALIAVLIVAMSLLGCIKIVSLVQACELRVVGAYGQNELCQQDRAQRMRSYLIAKGLGELEVDVIMKSLAGHTIQEIAKEVNYSPSTVKAVRHGAFAQLGIHGVHELPSLFDQLEAL